MSKEWLEETIQALLPKLESKGIVTVEDSIYLDHRKQGREISYSLQARGYTQYQYIEVNMDNYCISTAAIYNSNIFSYEEAVAYMDSYMENDYQWGNS